MKRLFALITIALLLCPLSTSAQEDYDDYLLFKYNERRTRYALEQEPSAEAMFYARRRSAIEDLLLKAEYNLSAVEYARRGEEFYEERYLASRIEVGYLTARLLRNLDIAYHNDYNITTLNIAHSPKPHEQSYYANLSLSGRNSLGRARLDASLPRVGGGGLTLHLDGSFGPDIYMEGLRSDVLNLAARYTTPLKRGKLSLIALMPIARRSLRQSTTAEVYALTNNYAYNPAWGYDGRQRRSARMMTKLNPTALATWSARLWEKSEVEVATLIEFERRGVTAPAWYNAVTPLPDNYHYLPSYYDDITTIKEITESWQSHDPRYTQLSWDEMRRINALQSDRHAVYAIEERMLNRTHSALNITLHTNQGELTFDYGIGLKLNSARYYKRMNDLLGADHIVDMDYFIKDDATYGHSSENNLLDPQRRIHDGDRFGYDYRLTTTDISAYGAVLWQRDNIFAEASAELHGLMVVRRGYYEKQLFAGRGSLGRSQRITMAPYRLRARWQYMLREHTMGLDVQLREAAPTADNLFLQPQYNNRTVANPVCSRLLSGAASYALQLPRCRLTATAYVAWQSRMMEIIRYYDDLAGVYTNTVVADAGRLNFGVELCSEVEYSDRLSSHFILTAGRHAYTPTADVTIYADADNSLVAHTTSDLSHCYHPSPMITALADIRFRSLSGWSIDLSVQCWALRHAEPSPIRRTERVVSFASSPEERAALLEQERLRDCATLNLTVAKSIAIIDEHRLTIRLSADNILGSRHIHSSSEQHRIRRQVVAERTHLHPFDNRIMYGYGRTLRLSIGLSF